MPPKQSKKPAAKADAKKPKARRITSLGEIDKVCQMGREFTLQVGEEAVTIGYRQLTPREKRRVLDLASGIVIPRKMVKSDDGGYDWINDMGDERWSEYEAKHRTAVRQQRALACAYAADMFREDTGIRDLVTERDHDKLVDAIESHASDTVLDVIHDLAMRDSTMPQHMDFTSTNGAPDVLS